MASGSKMHPKRTPLLLVTVLVSAIVVGAQEPSLDEALKTLGSAEPHFAQGLKAFRAGHPKEAVQALEKCVGIMPGHAFARYYLANLAYLEGDHARALEHMARAMEGLDLMRQLEEHARRLKVKRIDSYRQMLEAEWNNPHNCRESRELESLSDELDSRKAKLDLKAGAGRDAWAVQKAHYLYFAGNILFQLQRFPEALERYEQAIGLDPRHADAYNNAAAVCYLAGDHARALALLDAAAGQGLEDNVNLKLVHLVREAMGRPTEGVLSEDLSEPEGGDIGVMRFALATKEAGSQRPPLYENAYLVYSRATRQAALVDPGAEDPRIEAFVREKGLEVRAVLNTHGHSDHASADAYYAGLFKAPVHASRADAAAYALRADRLLDDGDDVRLGGLTFRALLTPGHTPGSLCFVVGDYLFSGDTLFRGDIGRVAEEDPAKALKARDALVRIIKRKLLTLSGTTRVCPGHGKASTVADEAAANPFLK